MTTEGLKTLGEAETNEVTGNEVGQADETGALKSGSISIDGKQTDLGGLSKKLETWDNIVDGGITDEAGASYVDEVPEDVQREVGEALLGILPGTGEAIEAKEAYQAFQAAREALRQGDLSDAGINAALAGVSAAGTVPVLGKAPAYAKKVVRLLARGIDTATDGTSLGKAAGAAAIGATGALVQDTPRNDEKNVGAERAMLDRPFPPPPGFEPPDTPLPDRTESLPTEKLNELKDTYPALEEIDTILEGFPDQRDEFTQILILMASSRGTPKTQRRTNFTLNRSLNKLKEIKCIGLIGGSKFFSPGADIKELEKLNSKKAKKQKLFSKVDDLQKVNIPIISFVEGYALGGGFELALSSDLIIASSDAKFGLPEINLGLIPGIGGTQKMKKFTSNQNVKYLAMSGEIINAETAMKYGIVSQIVPKENFKDFINNFLNKISSKPKKSLQIIKSLINSEENLKKTLKKERNEFYKLLDSDNKKIGIESFLNKTKPNWK